MRWKFNLDIFLLLIVLVYSCKNGGFTETSSGLRYKIVKNGSGPSFMKGKYVVLNMEYYNEKDSILYSSIVRAMPVTMLYNDSIWKNSGQAYEGFSKLKVGDSAILIVQCSNLYQKSFRMPVPDGLDPKELITFKVGVSKTMNEEEFKVFQRNMIDKRQAERIARENKQLIEDIAIIDRYLDEKKIIPMETESGLRYLIQKEGKGSKPTQADIVVVDYTGTLLDGSVFDTSKKAGKPFEFPVGQGVVVKGWDEGVSLMSKGSKYTFYIPSPLAYGDRSSGPIIKPNSILVFDVELLDIKRK